jgi:hypothetical protein
LGKCLTISKLASEVKLFTMGKEGSSVGMYMGIA